MLLFSKASGRVLQASSGAQPFSYRSVRRVKRKVTAVRADGKLATRQDTVDKHNTAIANINDKELEKKFAELIQNHNKASNV